MCFKRIKTLIGLKQTEFLDRGYQWEGDKGMRLANMVNSFKIKL